MINGRNGLAALSRLVHRSDTEAPIAPLCLLLQDRSLLLQIMSVTS